MNSKEMTLKSVVSKLGFTISRGGILDITTQVEDLLTSIIAWCFYPTYKECDEKQDIRLHGTVDNMLNEKAMVLKSLILTRLSLDRKIELLGDSILAIHEDSYNKNSTLISEIQANLGQIRKFRNLLAHSPLYREHTKKPMSHEDLPFADFQIREYKKGKFITHRIDASRLMKEQHKTTVTFYKLRQLFALLRRSQKEAEGYRQFSDLTQEALRRVGLKLLGLE
jgi:hypothetical protein